LCEKEYVLRRVKEERDILHTIETKKVNWMGHNLCLNCLEKTHYYRKDRREKKRRKMSAAADLNKNRRVEFKRRSTRSHSLENSLWKRLRT